MNSPLILFSDRRCPLNLTLDLDINNTMEHANRYKPDSAKICKVGDRNRYNIALKLPRWCRDQLYNANVVNPLHRGQSLLYQNQCSPLFCRPWTASLRVCCDCDCCVVSLPGAEIYQHLLKREKHIAPAKHNDDNNFPSAILCLKQYVLHPSRCTRNNPRRRLQLHCLFSRQERGLIPTVCNQHCSRLKIL